MELRLGNMVSYDVREKEFRYFIVDIPDCNRILRVKVTPRNRYSELQLYINNSAEVPDRRNYTWKEVGAGMLNVEVWPGDSQYKVGRYCLGVYGYWEGFNSFNLLADLYKVRPIKEIEGSCSSTIEEFDHYIWRIKHPGESRLLIEVDAGNLAIFTSSLIKYPDEFSHCYSSGYFEASEAKPILDPYSPTFELSYNLKLTIPFSKAPSDLASRDSVKLCINTDDWAFGKTECYITVKNLQSSSLPYNIHVVELSEEQALSHHRASLYRIFKSLYAEVDGASQSYYERQRLNMMEMVEFTYGEVEFAHIVQLLDQADPAQGEIFVDLGCGTGKCVITAALAYPQLAEARGIELLQPLNDSFQAVASQLPPESAKVTTILGNIYEIDWTDSDIVYTSSVCFSPELLQFISSTAERLKQGSRIVSLKALNLSSIFELKCSVMVKMTWGYSEAYVYYKTR